MHKTNRLRGKNTQRKVAQLLGAKNQGILGGEDAEHPIFSIEIKHRSTFAGTRFMTQAVRNCPEGKVPIVVVHMHREQHGHDLVIVRLSDFISHTMPTKNH